MAEHVTAVIVCVGILGSLVSLTIVWFRIKAYRVRRAFVLDLWRKNQLPVFLSGEHNEPVSKLKFTENLVRQYHYTDDELGISLHSLLERAVVCQRNKIVRLKEFESQSMSRVELMRKDVGLDTKGFLHQMNMSAPNFVRLGNEIGGETVLHEELNRRWIKSNGRDPENTPRLDICVAQNV